MSRPLRIEFPGAYYHVMNRGNRREDIFLTDKDRTVFLDGLADSCETYRIKLIAYSEYLKKYPWSTFPGHCYLRKRNKNIDYGWLLSTYFGEHCQPDPCASEN